VQTRETSDSETRGAAHRDHQVVDPAGRDAFAIGLHDHRMQRDVNPARRQQSWEVRLGASLDILTLTPLHRS
jgi:hypothetical protein